MTARHPHEDRAMTLQDKLLTLAAVKFMTERLAEVEAIEKAGIKAEVGGRMGATGAVLPDGTEAATVWITKPRSIPADPGGTPYVSNPALFTDWVETVDPNAIVTSVRSTDVPRLLAKAFQTLQDTGELPPGIELSEPSPASTSGGGAVSVRQSDEQKANLLRALLAGEVPLPSLAPQIEGSDA